MASTETSPFVAAPEPEASVVTKEPQTSKPVSYYTYAVYFFAFVAVILLIWYMYARFSDNSSGLREPFTDGQKQERDDTAADFNVAEEVDKLNRKQKQILSGLSQSTGM